MKQWEALEKRVLAWRTSLAGVMEVVASAKDKVDSYRFNIVLAKSIVFNGPPADVFIEMIHLPLRLSQLASRHPHDFMPVSCSNSYQSPYESAIIPSFKLLTG
jgi:hypothetical protein